MSNDDSLAVYRDASPWRRFGAFGIDYFVVILPFLGLCSLAGWAFMWLEITPFHPSRPWLNQGIIILFLTVPIACYFALCPLRKSAGSTATKTRICGAT